MNNVEKDRKVYGWKVPLYPKVNAQDAGEFIDSLTEKDEGMVSPKQLVDAARDPASILHPCFEWDDSEAAEKYRLKQARKVLQNLQIIRVERVIAQRNVKVTVIDPNNLDMGVSTEKATESIPVPVRAFLRAEANGRKAYMQTEKVLSDAELRENAMASVKNDIRNFVNKYRGLAGIADILRELAAEMQGA